MTGKKSETGMPDLYPDILKTLQGAMSMNPAVTPQIEQFWDAQERVLDEAETYARHWFERRHEATRTALEAARAATSSDKGDAARAFQAVAEWQRHSAERLVEDAREWYEMVTRCANYVTETETEVVEEALDEAAKMAKKSVKASKSEPV